MNPVELRAASAEDESFIHDLMICTMEEELAAWSWPEPMRSQLLEMQYLGRVNGLRSTWPGMSEQVILQDSALVGRVAVASTPYEIRVLDIAVLPERRNTGIGTAVLGKLLHQARCTGRPVRLQVNQLSRAAPLYERLGFQRVASSELQHCMEWLPSLS